MPANSPFLNEGIGAFSLDESVHSNGLVGLATRADQLNSAVRMLGVAVEVVNDTPMLHLFRDADDLPILPIAYTRASIIRRSQASFLKEASARKPSAEQSRRVKNKEFDALHISKAFLETLSGARTARLLPFTHTSEHVSHNLPRLSAIVVSLPINGISAPHTLEGLTPKVEPVDTILEEFEMYAQEQSNTPYQKNEWTVMAGAVYLGAAYGTSGTPKNRPRSLLKPRHKR